MSRFVDECRKEWKRLSVPEMVANEMAEDLEADLAEAEAEGVSPEEVLGRGYFDPRSFAASWATARGVAAPGAGVTDPVLRRSWRLALGAAACLLVAALGLVLLVGRPLRSASAAVVRIRPPMFRPVPGILVGPHGTAVLGVGHTFALVGAVLILAALVGLGLTLWFWKPWAKRGGGPDPDVGLPSYL